MALIEYALVAPLLLLSLFAALELGALCWARLSMQHAVREAGRFALIAYHREQPARDRAFYALLQRQSFGVYARLQTRCVMTSINGGAWSPACTDEAPLLLGAGNDTVRLRLHGCWRLSTPLASALTTDGRYCFDATTLYRNEP
jgi:hypothetical protein